LAASRDRARIASAVTSQQATALMVEPAGGRILDRPVPSLDLTIISYE
jgi:hypothetical protein